MGKTGQLIAQKKDPTIGPELDAKLMEASSQTNEAKAEEKKVKCEVVISVPYIVKRILMPKMIIILHH